MKCDACKRTLVSHQASADTPYQYRASGLDYIFLIGIEVRVCPKCRGEMPVVPRMGELHRAIARGLVEKAGVLAGDDVRFLRKHAGISSQDFAALLMVTPETLSRIENGRQESGATLDKMIRATAAAARSAKDGGEILLAAPNTHIWKRVVLKPTKSGWSEAA